MPTTKNTKKTKKSISPRHRMLVDVYLNLNCNLTAAANACRISPTAACQAMKRREVKSYLAERQTALTEALTTSAAEIISVLVAHLRADIADVMPDEPLLRQARKNGVSRLVKKIKIKETVKRVKSGESAGGEGEAEEEIIDRHVELELYSAQEAAKTLAKIFDVDSRDDLQRARTAIKMYCEMRNCEPEVAIVALAPHVPAVLKVKDEFVRPRWPEEIDAGESGE